MTKIHKKIKLEDIAKKLNVTKVTVSKALRDHPDISDATIELVKETAEKMGYLPNIAARNLSANKTNTIGLVVPKVAHYFFGSIIEYLYDHAAKNNYELILTVSQENPEEERKHIQTLLAMNVDGLIIAITKETKDYGIFKTVEQHDVPVVFIDRTPDLKDVNKVVASDRQGSFNAIEHAINLGYRDIAYLASYTNVNIGSERLAGYKNAMKKSGLKINSSRIIKGDSREKFGYDSIKRLYENNDLPEFIFTETYPVALGIYKAANELKLIIPKDFDLICFGYADVQNYLNPPLSCVSQPAELLAERSFNMLLENIKNKKYFVKKEEVIPTDLILRGTCIKRYRRKNDKR